MNPAAMTPISASRLLPSPHIGAALLIVLTLAVVGVARWRSTHAPAEAGPPTTSTVVQRQLRFIDRSDGGVDVIDVQHPERSEVLAPGTDGFLRATLRTFARERKRQGFGAELPFHLNARSDGRLILADPATGRQVDLEAFGPSNSGRFARLLRPALPATLAAAPAAKP